uniref:Reverse transcriptase domain-containing protein n=1 Tax=Tanacetum cinerariifolium TaxID=118510 RepID=A0A6L2N5Y5_TANCI|nr:hypothetical protein [Tanacetum cinerariifolium]
MKLFLKYLRLLQSHPFYPTVEPEDSLTIRDKDLNTIPEKELDDVIKFSVKDLVLIPSEFEVTSGSIVSVIYLRVMISLPLTDVNPLFDEVFKGIEGKDFYDSNLDELALLITPLFDYNDDECFDPGGDVIEINAFDIPKIFKDDYYDSEGDVLYLESLLSDNTIPNLPPEVFLGHDPRSLNNINDLKIIWLEFSTLEFQRICFSNIVDSPLFFSSRSKDTIFDLGISAFHFSSLELVASHRSGTFMCFLNESLMKICSSTRFNPNIMMI